MSLESTYCNGLEAFLGAAHLWEKLDDAQAFCKDRKVAHVWEILDNESAYEEFTDRLGLRTAEEIARCNDAALNMQSYASSDWWSWYTGWQQCDDASNIQVSDWHLSETYAAYRQYLPYVLQSFYRDGMLPTGLRVMKRFRQARGARIGFQTLMCIAMQMPEEIEISTSVPNQPPTFPHQTVFLLIDTPPGFEGWSTLEDFEITKKDFWKCFITELHRFFAEHSWKSFEQMNKYGLLADTLQRRSKQLKQLRRGDVIAMIRVALIKGILTCKDHTFFLSIHPQAARQHAPDAYKKKWLRKVTEVNCFLPPGRVGKAHFEER
jgi:hypothetical protein